MVNLYDAEHINPGGHSNNILMEFVERAGKADRDGREIRECVDVYEIVKG